jgi:hypothetical protein
MRPIPISVALLLLVACASPPKSPEAVAREHIALIKRMSRDNAG